jgi:hypothetical protein
MLCMILEKSPRSSSILKKKKVVRQDDISQEVERVDLLNIAKGIPKDSKVLSRLKLSNAVICNLRYEDNRVGEVKSAAIRQLSSKGTGGY